MASGEQSRKLSYSAAKMRCQGPDVKDLSPEELAALHVLKHEMLASLYRLYTTMSEEVAEPIVKSFLISLINDMESKA
jgi:hypothetical protein